MLVGSDGARETKADLIAFWTADGFDPSPVTVVDPVEILRDGSGRRGRGGDQVAATVALRRLREEVGCHPDLDLYVLARE